MNESPWFPRLRDGLIVRQIDDDFVIYDPERDRTSVLNASAAAILSHCDGRHRPDQIEAAIAAARGMDQGILRSEVESALREFVLEGLIEPSTG